MAPQVTWLARLLSVSLLLASALGVWRACRDLWRASLRFTPEGVFYDCEGHETPVERLEWIALGHLRALTLHFSGGQVRRCVLMRDGLPSEGWRRLNVLLRWRTSVAVQLGARRTSERNGPQA